MVKFRGVILPQAATPHADCALRDKECVRSVSGFALVLSDKCEQVAVLRHYRKTKNRDRLHNVAGPLSRRRRLDRPTPLSPGATTF